MPTVGVSPTKENFKDWFNAGVTYAGMGSKLISKNTDFNYNLAKIESDTKAVIKIITVLKK